MRFLFPCLAFAAVFLLAGGPALAQTAAASPNGAASDGAATAGDASRAARPDVDKSGFTLWNPVPTVNTRDFSPDRPGKANSPFTVDAGHFQYETDFLNETYSRNNGVTTRVTVFADPVLKAGLTNDTDLELGFTGAQHVTTSGRGLGGAGMNVWGTGDLVPRLKWNLWGDDGGRTALAVIPYVKLPTASHNIGNNLVEGGALATLGINLPYDFAAILMTEFDALKNGANSGRHGNFLNLVNLSHPIIGDLSGSVEVAADVANDRNTPASYTLGLNLTYPPRPDLQLDAGTAIGLTPRSPALTIFAGISQRF